MSTVQLQSNNPLLATCIMHRLEEENRQLQAEVLAAKSGLHTDDAEQVNQCLSLGKLSKCKKQQGCPAIVILFLDFASSASAHQIIWQASSSIEETGRPLTWQRVGKLTKYNKCPLPHEVLL